MKIALGGDHRATSMLRAVGDYLTKCGHSVSPVGVCEGDSCDYPDQTVPVADAVRAGEVDLGILACGSGNGVAIAANKIAGIRAVIGFDAEAAKMGRAHNDANILCLSADRHADDFAPIVDAFLSGAFEGGRHARRVEKLTALEQPQVAR